MIPIHPHEPPRKLVTLAFKRSELLYDIQNYAYIEGDIKQTDDEHQKHQVFDIVEDGNVDRVTRVLDLAFAQCVEACYPYSKTEVCNDAYADDTLEPVDNYMLYLLVPHDMSATTINLLCKTIHELLVYKVMADWLSITKPESVATWQNKITEHEGRVSTMLNARIRRVRRTQTPF